MEQVRSTFTFTGDCEGVKKFEFERNKTAPKGMGHLEGVMGKGEFVEGCPGS